MSRAAIYTRISRDPLHDELGVRRQERDCRDLCAREGYEVAAVFSDDDRSAYSGKQRPAYTRLLDAIRAGEINVVVAWHPDRLTRHPRELEDLIEALERSGCTVSTVQAGHYDLGTPSGRMVARIIGNTARYESEHKSARLRRKHQELAEAGKLSGGGTRPFGFEADRITHRPAEAAIIRELVARTIAGDSLRSLCADLARRGINGPTGRPWSPTALRTVLMSARIAGMRDHRTGAYPAVWSPIISVEDHRRAVAILTDPRRRRTRPGATRYLLTGGLAVCGLCGANLVARPRSDGRRCYVCASDPQFGGCGKIRSLTEPLDDLVIAAVIERASSPALAAACSGLAAEDQTALHDLIGIEDRLKELGAMWAAGDITREAMSSAEAALVARRASLEALIADEASTRTIAATDYSRLADTWADLTIEDQRRIVGTMIRTVTVGPAVRGRNTFDPGRVSVDWKV